MVRELKEFIPIFLKNKSRAAEKAHSSLELGDFEDLRIFGHNLKGDSPPYGFIDLGHLGEELEEAVMSSPQDLEALKKILSKISKSLEGHSRSLHE